MKGQEIPSMAAKRGGKEGATPMRNLEFIKRNCQERRAAQRDRFCKTFQKQEKQGGEW